MYLFVIFSSYRYLCTDTRINTIDTAGVWKTGPIVYLLKVLVHQAGFSCLRKYLETHEDKLQWLNELVLQQDEVSIARIYTYTLEEVD